MSELSPDQLVRVLAQSGIGFDTGLTDVEVDRVQAEFCFRFPPDLRAFLQTAMPVGKGFPDWRNGPSDALAKQLGIPLRGILFDVEHNAFWLDEWGPRPKVLAEAFSVVTKLHGAAPVLIPIYIHRMMPDRPHLAGNPVFSVHQTDIIYYGSILSDYFRHEFAGGDWKSSSEPVRDIEFWNIDRFQSVRWAKGSAMFDNRDKILP
jgi:hypothetical protein